MALLRMLKEKRYCSNCNVDIQSVSLVIIMFIDTFELFEKVLTSLINDQGFTLSQTVQRARLCAERLLEWTTANKEDTLKFCLDLNSSLQLCLIHPRKVKCRTLRERIWEKYYKLRASASFTAKWDTFLQRSIGFGACPIFFQYVTDKIMEILIKEHFPVESTSTLGSGKEAISLDYEESNALHYTAGYVIRSLTKKLMRSKHHLKDELILCLREMTEGNVTLSMPQVFTCFHYR